MVRQNATISKQSCHSCRFLYTDRDSSDVSRLHNNDNRPRDFVTMPKHWQLSFSVAEHLCAFCGSEKFTWHAKKSAFNYGWSFANTAMCVLIAGSLIYRTSCDCKLSDAEFVAQRTTFSVSVLKNKHNIIPLCTNVRKSII